MAYEIVDNGKTIIWTVGPDKIGAQLVYNLYEDGSLKETRIETCLAPRGSRSIQPSTFYDYLEVPSSGETLVDRPKAVVTVTAAVPAAIVGDWTTEIYDVSTTEVTAGANNKVVWLLADDTYPCGPYDCWGGFYVRVDEAKWVPDPTGNLSIHQSDSWFNTVWTTYNGARHFCVVVTYLETWDKYPAGTVLPKTYNVPFLKTREVVSVQAQPGQAGTVTKSNPLPAVPDVSTMGLKGLPEGYEWGSSVTITATPASGYRFDHWEYLGSDTDPHGINGSTNSTETFEALPRVYSSETDSYSEVESFYRAIFVLVGTPHLLCSKSSPHRLLCSGTSPHQLLWGNV